MTGQMTLFDLVEDDQKSEFEIKLPDVGEYAKETSLAFEKEVLGIYISGHPLEAYEETWKRNISATTADFQPDEETGRAKVRDGAKEIVGGMITEKTVKATKTNQMMAFLTVEDLLGTVEIVVFPRDYEKNREYLEVDQKVFVKGRVSEEEEKASKLICEKIIPFERTKKELWIQFPDKMCIRDRFQNVNRNEKMKTAVVEAAKLPELITKEAIGVTVNPFGVNLVLQLPGRAKPNN